MTIDFSQQKEISSEVYHASTDVFGLSRSDIKELINLARNVDTKRRRVRFCTHNSRNEPVHQMFIVHPVGTYVRPHKHLGKSESMLVIEGDVDYILFDDFGNVNEVVTMGDYGSGKTFYHSIGAEQYHTLRIQSDWLIFLEITKGPFSRDETKFAKWSPDGEEPTVAQQYIYGLND